MFVSASRQCSSVCTFSNGESRHAVSAGEFTVGDGLSIAETSATAAVVVTDNVFNDNERFGAVFSGVTATLSRNSGTGNRYGLGAYAGAPMVDASNSIAGANPAPSIANVSRGYLAR